MLGSVSLGGTSLHYVDATPGRHLTRAEGLVGPSAPRVVLKPRTERHGAVDRSLWLGEKVITLEGACWGSTYEEAWAQFDLIAKAARNTLSDTVANRLLTWQVGDSGRQLQADVRLTGPILPVLDDPAELLRYQLQLSQPDPRSYSQTLSTAIGTSLSTAAGGLTFPATFPITFTASGGGTAAVNNAGTVETPLIMRVYGYATSPRVMLVGTGETITLTGEVGTGDYLEIDTQERTVKLNGTANRANLVTASATTWFELPVGADTIRLIASNFDASAHVEVEYRSAYL